MGIRQAAIIDFTDEQFAQMEPAPEEGELVTCPACQTTHPLRYDTEENRSLQTCGFVECDGKYLLAVFKGKIIGKMRPINTSSYWGR